jgi:hypothetical protein
MRSESSRRKFMATAVTATTLLLVFGLRLVGRAESQTSAKAGATTQEKIARAMSAGPDNISESARIIDTDAQGNKVILREGSNGFTCMPGNPNVVGEPPMCVDAASIAVVRRRQGSQTQADQHSPRHHLYAGRGYAAQRFRSE